MALNGLRINTRGLEHIFPSSSFLLSVICSDAPSVLCVNWNRPFMADLAVWFPLSRPYAKKHKPCSSIFPLGIYIYMFVCVWLCMHVVLCPFVACFNAVSRLWEVSTGVDVQMHVFISHETCQKKVIFHLKIQAKIGTFYLAWRELKVEFSVFLMWHYLLDNLSTFAPSKWLMSLLPRRASRGFWGKKTQWNAF